MKPETKKEINQILRRVVCCEIPVKWRTNSATPGAGNRRTTYRGTNRHDFESLDKYQPGDDPRFINWKATAQTGMRVIYKNQYFDQRDLKVYIVADVSRSMDFGTVRATKRFLSAELAASICRSAEETADRVGFIAFSEHRVEKVISTRAAKRAMLPALVNILETPSSRSGQGSGLVKALSALPLQRSLVFVLSDFHHLSDEEKTALRRAALVHDVVCLVVQDRRERELPPGWGFFTFQDLESGERVTIFLSPGNRKKFAENGEHKRVQFLAFLKKIHVSWLVVSTEEGDAAFPKIMKLFAGHNR
jgi:uncharacterized protein (DUF58 family)